MAVHTGRKRRLFLQADGATESGILRHGTFLLPKTVTEVPYKTQKTVFAKLPFFPSLASLHKGAIRDSSATHFTALLWQAERVAIRQRTSSGSNPHPYRPQGRKLGKNQFLRRIII